LGRRITPELDQHNGLIKHECTCAHTAEQHSIAKCRVKDCDCVGWSFNTSSDVVTGEIADTSKIKLDSSAEVDPPLEEFRNSPAMKAINWVRGLNPKNYHHGRTTSLDEEQIRKKRRKAANEGKRIIGAM
jgi:hypothetical protein